MLAEYRIFETDQFEKDLHTLSKSGQIRIAKKLKDFVYPQLEKRPHFGPHIKKLKHFEPETWRYRIGAWRFFYEIDEPEKIVFMIAAQHRSHAY